MKPTSGHVGSAGWIEVPAAFNPDNRSSVSAASDRPSVTLEMPPSTQSPVGRGSVVATEQAMSQDV